MRRARTAFLHVKRTGLLETPQSGIASHGPCSVSFSLFFSFVSPLAPPAPAPTPARPSRDMPPPATDPPLHTPRFVHMEPGPKKPRGEDATAAASAPGPVARPVPDGADGAAPEPVADHAPPEVGEFCMAGQCGRRRGLQMRGDADVGEFCTAGQCGCRRVVYGGAM